MTLICSQAHPIGCHTVDLHGALKAVRPASTPSETNQAYDDASSQQRKVTQLEHHSISIRNTGTGDDE
nr:hypothetical protein CFP56_09260 [Quercus suber]